MQNQRNSSKILWINWWTGLRFWWLPTGSRLFLKRTVYMSFNRVKLSKMGTMLSSLKPIRGLLKWYDWTNLLLNLCLNIISSWKHPPTSPDYTRYRSPTYDQSHWPRGTTDRNSCWCWKKIDCYRYRWRCSTRTAEWFESRQPSWTGNESSISICSRRNEGIGSSRTNAQG